MLPVVAIVGRPNVGKSSLFNQLTQTNDALVADFHGLTRDRIYGHLRTDKSDIILIDTGGLDHDHGDLSQVIKEQTDLAIEESDLIIMIVDGREGLTNSDQEIAQALRKKNKSVLVAINKTEGMNSQTMAADFYSLGFKAMLSISALRGDHCEELISKILEILGMNQADSGYQEIPEEKISIALIGRPNVGKSTFINGLLKEERLLTENQPGTTRDSIHIDYQFGNQDLILIDTAGIRRKKKVGEAIEKFSIVKALQALDLSDAVIVMIDGDEGITDQDLSLIGLVLNSGRAFIITINKYDLLDEAAKEMVDRQIKRKLKFAAYVDVQFISALKRKHLKQTMNGVLAAAKNAMRTVPTSELSSLIERLMETDPPPYIQGRRIKLKYAHQGGIQPPTFIIYGNQTKKLRDNYKKFIERQIRSYFSFMGTPIQLFFKDSKNPFSDRKNKLSHRQWKKRRRVIRLRKKRS
ncbi:MAG TPA: ribosome biogenesis GTPase Der [Gammaproteobacteria bacterium]|nr:ribosome biogenesis GTPase Der [Gammaproteobacteria bacterium]